MAQAGAQLDSHAADAADGSRVKDKTPSASDLPAAVPAGIAAVTPPVHAARDAAAASAEPRGSRTGPKVVAGAQAGDDAPVPGSVDGTAPLAGGATGATGAADAAAAEVAPGITAAATAQASRETDGRNGAASARIAPDDASGKSAAPHGPFAGTPAATTIPGGAAQAALQLALREASATAPGLAMPATTSVELTAERESRTRRSGPDAAGGRSAAGAAGRNPSTMVDGMGASGSLTGNAAADVASLAAASADPQTGGLATTPSPGAGADPSVFALTMNQVSTNTLAATRAEMMAELTQTAIDVPVDHGDFAEAFARQSASLVVQGSSHAEIQLNPRDMGPIRILIALDADAASLDIQAGHADTRAAIEASMPALRQMLADQGVRLADWRLDSQSTGGREQAAGDTGRHESRHSAAQQPGGQQAGGNGTGHDTGNAMGNGFGSGREGNPAGGHVNGWRAGAGMRDAPGPLRQEPRGGPGGGNNNRIDLYA